MKKDYVYFQAAKGMNSNPSSFVPVLTLNSRNCRAVERKRNQREVKKYPLKKLSQHSVHAYLSLHIGMSRVFKNLHLHLARRQNAIKNFFKNFFL